jgi:hypothetical protein
MMENGGKAGKIITPAFPEFDHISRGMSLRDWFAGMALAGMRATGDALNMPGFAQWCYAVADAMLAEREKEA